MKSIKCKLGWHLPHTVTDLNLGEKYSYCERCKKELWRIKLEEELIEKFREAEEKIKAEKPKVLTFRAYCNQCQAYKLFNFSKELCCTACGKVY